MFRSAVAKASEFTYPVIMSRRSVAKECGGGCGSFIVVNDQGWIVTAGHVIDQITQMVSEESVARSHESREAAIRTDASLSDRDRRVQLKALGKLDPAKTMHAAVWWGGLGDGLQKVARVPGLDFAVAQLSNFDASKVSSYASFKTSFNAFVPGVSLCKLGYPFFSAVPGYDDQSGSFSYPQHFFTPRSFPIDGILTRTQEVQVVDASGNVLQSPFPLVNVETSTPGLRGQSGGPMFDVDGVVWAIQSFTTHTPLGFAPTIKVGTADLTEHQFINLGTGPASVSIADLLRSIGVQFNESP